jgi:hypothetical protein
MIHSSPSSRCCNFCKGSDGNKCGRNRLASRQLAQLSLVTTTLGISSELLTLAITLVYTLVLRAYCLRRSAASTDLRSVSEVAVDANKVGRHAVSFDILDDHVSRRLRRVVGAVATRPTKVDVRS